MRWFFVVILILSILVRFYRIGEVPLGMNWDEVSIAYNAWSIALWHRDEQANFMPLSFISFGDYKPSGAIYMLAIPYLVFGFHLEWVRYMSAFFGIGSVILAFLIAKEIDRKSKWLPYGAMLLMALSPWGVTLSRVGYEQNTAFFLVNLGVWSLLKGLKKQRWWLFSALPIAASLYVFHTAKVFWVGFLPLFVLINLKTFKQSMKWVWVSLLSLVIMVVPLVYDNIYGQGATRVNTLIGSGEVGVIQEFLRNIFNQLSWRFWVGGYDAVSIRHSVPEHGVITFIEAIFLIFGLFVVVKNIKRKSYQNLIAWWVMGLMPAILTHNTPHALRSLFALMPSIMIALIGLGVIIEYVRKKSENFTRFLLVITGMIYAIMISSYLTAYYSKYAVDSATAFQYGYRGVVEAINQYKNQVDRVEITDKYGQPYIYILTYNKIKPQDFLFGSLNQYDFLKINWLERQKNRLYAGTPEEIPVNDPAVVKVIYIPNTKIPVWVIAKT